MPPVYSTLYYIINTQCLIPLPHHKGTNLITGDFVNENTAVQFLDDARILADDLAEVRHHSLSPIYVIHPQTCTTSYPYLIHQ